MQFRALYWFNLLLLAVPMAINEAKAQGGEVRAMMRAADQAFRREFAEGYLRNAQSEQARTQKPIAREAARGVDAEPQRSGRSGHFAVAQPQAMRPPPPLPEASTSSPAGFTFRDCDFCPPLVAVPNGAFTMGSNEHPYEKPAHKVAITHPFAIGQHEVTYAEWDRCVGAGACRYRPDHRGSPGEAIGNLSWDDANAYLKWMSEKTGQIYRLPSEAEWEYAAGAGKSPVAGSQQINTRGLYDAAGNMAEWVQDCWNESYLGAPADGSAWAKGDCSLRVLRGGAFSNKTASSRSTSRFRYDSDVRYEGNGFRVLRELR